MADIMIAIDAQDRASRVLNNVARNVSTFGGTMAKLGNLGNIMTGVQSGLNLVSGAFRATAGAAMASADRIDALTDTARGLGEGVGNLQAFQYAMEEVGNVSPEQAVAALQKIQKTIGDVASGNNQEGANIMARLGLDPQQLAQQSPVDQFAAIRDAIQGIQNSSERAAIAQKLFGGNAAALVPALMAQREEFDASMQSARDLGVAVSDAGAAGIASMNDSLGKIKKSMEGLYNQVAIALAPAIKLIADNLSAWMPTLIAAAEKYMPTLVDMAAWLAGSFFDLVEAVGALFNRDWDRIDQLISGEGRRTEWVDKLRQAREDAAAEADRQAQENAAQTANAIKQEQDMIDKLAEEEKIRQENYTKQVESGDKVIEGMKRQIEVAEKGEETVKRNEQLAEAANDAQRAEIELLQRKLDLLDEEAKKREQIAEGQQVIESLQKELMAMDFGEETTKRSEALAKAATDEQRQEIERLFNEIDQRNQEQEAKRIRSNAMAASGPVQASQSRLLSRAQGQDFTFQKTTAENSKKQVKYLELLVKRPQPERLQIQMVGA